MKLQANRAVAAHVRGNRIAARALANASARPAAGLRMVWGLDRAGQAVMHWERRESAPKTPTEPASIEWAHPLGLALRLTAWLRPIKRDLWRLA